MSLLYEYVYFNMVAHDRIRTRNTYPEPGTLTAYSGSDQSIIAVRNDSIVRREEYCKDVVENYGGNNSFYHTKVERHFSTLNGIQVDFLDRRILEAINYPDTAARSHSAGHGYMQFKYLSTNDIFSRASPNRPMVDLPVFLSELKDIPGMVKEANTFGKQLPRAAELIKQAGDSLIRGNLRRKGQLAYQAGAANLSYQFGWKPLIQDLLQMMGLKDAIERRKREINKLISPRGLTKKVKIDEQKYEESYYSTFESTLVGLTGWEDVIHSGKAYAVLRFRSSMANPPSTKEIESMAWRSVLGLELSLATVWQAMPWSWLFDWFTDMGSYLDRTRNIVPSYVERACRCYYHNSTFTRRITARTPGIVGGEGSISRTTKERYPDDSWYLPTCFEGILSAGQVGILSSLSVARRGAWR